jgi:hypothetical protein
MVHWPQSRLTVLSGLEHPSRYPGIGLLGRIRGSGSPPLRSAEPHPATDAQRAELALTDGRDIPEPGQWIKDLAAGRRTFAGKLASRPDPSWADATGSHHRDRLVSYERLLPHQLAGVQFGSARIRGTRPAG